MFLAPFIFSVPQKLIDKLLECFFFFFFVASYSSCLTATLWSPMVRQIPQMVFGTPVFAMLERETYVTRRAYVMC